MDITIDLDYGFYYLYNHGRKLQPAYATFEDANGARDLLLDSAGNLSDNFDLERGTENPELEKGA